jgi:phosphoribosylaminoimidazole-succinocarboxamide synthase
MTTSSGTSGFPPAITALTLEGIPHYRSGKVREVFDLGEHLLFVATDRISAFDCILPTGIPLKGHVLNQISAWWFQRLRHIVPNHLVTTSVDDYPAALKPHRDILRGRSMMVRKTRVINVECVARGYLIGSGWKEYQAGRTVSGLRLREGYRLADRLDAPIFTPAHKAESGHDENIAFDEVAKREGAPRAARLRDLTLRIYGQAADYARQRGIILADTKFEFGLLGDELLLVDEVLTPDSSRFWPADTYAPGQSPASFDKQFVRDYLEGLDWDKRPPAPALPAAIVEKTQAKYLEAFRLLTGKELEL